MSARRSTRPQEQSRGRMLAQVIRTLVLLRVGRHRVGDLADELRVTTRTVYRLLHALRTAGIAVESQREGGETYYRIRREEAERLLRLDVPDGPDVPQAVPSTCSERGCREVVLARGLCGMHYRRVRRGELRAGHQIETAPSSRPGP